MDNYDQYGQSLFFYNPGPYTMTLSNNLYYSTHSASWRWGGNSYSSFSQWQTAGIESKPIEGDPLFSNAGNGGTCNWSPSQASGPQPCPSAYMLQSGSPAIAAGVTVSNNGGRDYYGNAIPTTPSIGAQAAVSGSGSFCHTGTSCARKRIFLPRRPMVRSFRWEAGLLAKATGLPAFGFKVLGQFSCKLYTTALFWRKQSVQRIQSGHSAARQSSTRAALA